MAHCRVVEASEALRVMTFDLENRPLHYAGFEWTSAEVTAMAWSWGDPAQVFVMLLNADGHFEYYLPGEMVPTLMDPDQALKHVRQLMKDADVVTGHYIRKHDLPMLNGACIELGVEPLPTLLVCDTKEDLVKRKDFSVSQENLAAAFGLKNPKHSMSQAQWRTANRLTREGIAGARTRVVSDVLQHMELRAELVRRKLLRAPRNWKSFR
jgi:hypothetical protein